MIGVDDKSRSNKIENYIKVALLFYSNKPYIVHGIITPFSFEDTENSNKT